MGNFECEFVSFLLVIGPDFCAIGDGKGDSDTELRFALPILCPFFDILRIKMKDFICNDAERIVKLVSVFGYEPHFFGDIFLDSFQKSEIGFPGRQDIGITAFPEVGGFAETFPICIQVCGIVAGFFGMNPIANVFQVENMAGKGKKYGFSL